MAKIGHPPTNSRNKPRRSDIGIELIRLLSSEGNRIFSISKARELAPVIGLNLPYLAEALYHLRKNDWIVPIRRGLYAITSSVPGVAPTHEFEIAMALVHPAAISHWSALHHYGLTEQPPHEVFVQTTTTSIPRVRGARRRNEDRGYPVGGVLYKFIQLKPNRFFGTDKIWVGDSQVMITDPERTLLDGLSMPQYCGDFSEVLHAFELKQKSLDLDRAINYAQRLDVATSSRLGWVLETQGIDPTLLEPLRLTKAKGYSKLDPTGPRRGPYNARWKIQENLPGKIGR